jgi:aspartate aminotransferase/aromatic-amino-acid transaminase
MISDVLTNINFIDFWRQKMWKNIEAAPADAILGLTEAFQAESRPGKVNLGVGVYKDETGVTPVLKCVKAAESILLETEKTKSYLPIPGDLVYGAEVQKLIFGESSEVISGRRAVTAQAPGGTGALRVGADLLKKFNKDAKLWLSNPSWANHRSVFSAAGYAVKEYPYYDADAKGVDFAAMKECLARVPSGDVVLLHACCHNPTGFDLSADQWKELVEVAKKAGWIPFLDFAYQGLGEGLEPDRVGVVAFAESGLDMVVASSFSKNFGLYRERVGAITLVTPSEAEAVVAMSHLKTVVRVLYSNPPAHGGLVVETVLTSKTLHSQWVDELDTMCRRIKEMRGKLVQGLEKRGVEQDFSYILRQCGMFSFSGLSKEMVEWLRVEKGIYMVGSGRINLAGLTPSNIDYVCDAIAEGLKQEK